MNPTDIPGSETVTFSPCDAVVGTLIVGGGKVTFRQVPPPPPPPNETMTEGRLPRAPVKTQRRLPPEDARDVVLQRICWAYGLHWSQVMQLVNIEIYDLDIEVMRALRHGTMPKHGSLLEWPKHVPPPPPVLRRVVCLEWLCKSWPRVSPHASRLAAMLAWAGGCWALAELTK